MRVFLVLIGVAVALPALGDASLPVHDSDEPVAHVIRVPARRVEMQPVELVSKKSVAPPARTLPIERLKREARADSADPLAFVDDTIDSGDICGHVATPLHVRIEPAPRRPKK